MQTCTWYTITMQGYCVNCRYLQENGAWGFWTNFDLVKRPVRLVHLPARVSIEKNSRKNGVTGDTNIPFDLKTCASWEFPNIYYTNSNIVKWLRTAETSIRRVFLNSTGRDEPILKSNSLRLLNTAIWKICKHFMSLGQIRGSVSQEEGAESPEETTRGLQSQ